MRSAIALTYAATCTATEVSAEFEHFLESADENEVLELAELRLQDIELQRQAIQAKRDLLLLHWQKDHDEPVHDHHNTKIRIKKPEQAPTAEPVADVPEVEKSRDHDNIVWRLLNAGKATAEKVEAEAVAEETVDSEKIVDESVQVDELATATEAIDEEPKRTFGTMHLEQTGDHVVGIVEEKFAEPAVERLAQEQVESEQQITVIKQKADEESLEDVSDHNELRLESNVEETQQEQAKEAVVADVAETHAAVSEVDSAKTEVENQAEVAQQAEVQKAAKTSKLQNRLQTASDTVSAVSNGVSMVGTTVTQVLGDAAAGMNQQLSAATGVDNAAAASSEKVRSVAREFMTTVREKLPAQMVETRENALNVAMLMKEYLQNATDSTLIAGDDAVAQMHQRSRELFTNLTKGVGDVQMVADDFIMNAKYRTGQMSQEEAKSYEEDQYLKKLETNPRVSEQMLETSKKTIERERRLRHGYPAHGAKRIRSRSALRKISPTDPDLDDEDDLEGVDAESSIVQIGETTFEEAASTAEVADGAIAKEEVAKEETTLAQKTDEAAAQQQEVVQPHIEFQTESETSEEIPSLLRIPAVTDAEFNDFFHSLKKKVDGSETNSEEIRQMALNKLSLDDVEENFHVLKYHLPHLSYDELVVLESKLQQFKAQSGTNATVDVSENQKDWTNLLVDMTRSRKLRNATGLSAFRKASGDDLSYEHAQAAKALLSEGAEQLREQEDRDPIMKQSLEQYHDQLSKPSDSWSYNRLRSEIDEDFASMLETGQLPPLKNFNIKIENLI